MISVKYFCPRCVVVREPVAEFLHHFRCSAQLKDFRIESAVERGPVLSVSQNVRLILDNKLARQLLQNRQKAVQQFSGFNCLVQNFKVHDHPLVVVGPA